MLFLRKAITYPQGVDKGIALVVVAFCLLDSLVYGMWYLNCDG